jgi:hypothetical protein
MRTPRYLPGVRNGVVAKRQSRATNPSTSKALGTRGSVSSRRRNSRRFSSHDSTRSAQSGSRRRSEGRGAKVMWLMILAGVALAAGFVFALRSQINAYRIAQAEEQLKSQLDEYTRQRQFLNRDKERAMNAGESDRAGKWNGLEHLRLDRASTERGVSVRKIVPIEPVREPRADQNDRSIKRPVRTGSQAKDAKLVKGVKTGKTANVVNVVKLKASNKTKADNKRQ